MPTKLAKYNKKIADRNRRFNALSPERQRVRIAKDVIKQLTEKRIRAKQGVYLSGTTDVKLVKKKDYWGNTFKEVDSGQDVQALVDKMKTCTACALGSVFACTVQLADQLKTDDLYTGSWTAKKVDLDGDDAYKYLSRFFSKEQLSLIETAFELRGMKTYAGCHLEYVGRLKPEVCVAGQTAIAFGKKYRNSGARMKAIMQNIIDNNGVFKP